MFFYLGASLPAGGCFRRAHAFVWKAGLIRHRIKCVGELRTQGRITERGSAEKGSHSPKCGSADRGEGKDQCPFYYVIRAQPPKLSLWASEAVPQASLCYLKAHDIGKTHWYQQGLLPGAVLAGQKWPDDNFAPDTSQQPFAGLRT